MKKTNSREPSIPVMEDRLLTYKDLAERWQLKEPVVKRRVLWDKIPVIRLNKRTVRIRFSDILDFERRATNRLPVGFTDGSDMRAKRGKAGVEK